MTSLKSAISETALASIALYHISSATHATHATRDQPGHGSRVGMKEMHRATERLRESITALSTQFEGNTHAHELDGDAVLHRAGLLHPPDKMMKIWDETEDQVGVRTLLNQQFKTCFLICTSPTMSPEEKATHLATLNHTVVNQLLPRLTRLRDAAADWQMRLLSITGVVIIVAFTCIVASILFTRFGVVGPLLQDLDVANANLSTENERLEQKVAFRTRDLMEAFKRTETAHEARTRFLASVNHEMRTPLNGVLGVAALLRETPLDQRQTQLVDTVVNSGQILVRLIDDVLDYVSLNAGKMQMISRNVPLHDVVAEGIELLRPVAVSKGLSFTFESRGCTGAVVEIDPDRMQQIVNNTVGNAIKFTRAGSVHLSLHQTLVGNRIHVEICIEDTGVGIDPDRLESMFEPFDRAALGVPTAGAGLGLAVTKALVEEMSGQISVESTPGQGSRFTIHLELPVQSEAHRPKAA